MSVLATVMEKQLITEGSNYHIRKAYLQAMKQFMTDDQNASRSEVNDDIEEYLLYEKQVSHHLQELLEQGVRFFDRRIPGRN